MKKLLLTTALLATTIVCPKYDDTPYSQGYYITANWLEKDGTDASILATFLRVVCKDSQSSPEDRYQCRQGSEDALKDKSKAIYCNETKIEK